MRIDIISAVPDLLLSPLNESIIKRSQAKGLVEIVIHNLRDYTHDRHRQIDDKPFGGGAGMILKPEPFFECITILKNQREYDHVIFTAPFGRIYDQKTANQFSMAENILFIAGHYRGIDDRVREAFATNVISIGNYVLSGGELPSLVIIDSIIRLIPGVLNDSESALNDSFMLGDMIAAPDYTRPADYMGMRVPDELLTGNHKLVADWKIKKSKEFTEIWKKNNYIVE